MNDLKTEFSLTTAGRYEADGWAVYPNSLLFEAGDYPDKSFSLTPGEMLRSAELFAGAQGNIEHTDFLAGRACDIRRVWVDSDGKTLRGELAVPIGLDVLLKPEEKKLSCEWNRDTKQLTGIGLVMNPRVPHAALMSAFTEFSKGNSAEFARHNTPEGQSALQEMHDLAARRGAVCDASKVSAKMSSKHEGKAIQSVHDACVAHGATCASTNATGKDAPYYFKKDTTMTLKEKILAFFTGENIDLDADIEASALAPKTPSVTDPRIAAMSAEIEALRSAAIDKDAVAFAESEIAARRALPAERDSLIALYAQAAKDDAAHPQTVTFGEGKQGSRVDALKSQQFTRKSHGLTEEMLRTAIEKDELVALMSRAASPDPNAEKPMDEKRRKELLNHSPLGAQILAGGAKGNK